MLSSILSLYIASSIHAPVFDQPAATSEPTNFVKMASQNLSELVSTNPIPTKTPQFISPIIEASSSISIDMKTGAILYEKSAHERRPIASITKLMTALIILEENKLNETVKVSHLSAITEGSNMFLRENEEISLENLMYGLMINSANDAAVALAEHNAESVDKFVEKMNKKALKLGLVNTHFSNPIGLDHPDNYSSAYDIAKLAKHVYENKFIQHAATVKTMEVKSTDNELIHKLESTNILLENDFLRIKGLKTGRTDGAGLCMVGVAENKNDNEIITVVLNSPDRFKETKVLTDWTFRAYNW